MSNVIIFGTNKGIGLELTKRYVKNGDKVFSLCRSASNELRDLGSFKIIEDCDVTDEKKLKKIALQLDEYRFDILIHNAGIWREDSIFSETQDWNNFTETFEVNSIAPLKVLHCFSHLLKDGSKVGLMSSRMGSISDNDSGGRYSYRMSKCALNCAGKSLSIDLIGRRISIAVLHPGYVKTSMTDYNGLIDSDESANGLFSVMEKLDLNDTGKFWHSNGETLPW
jgi:NAD(P)-dependent dehydrogenase (short-subunit alcohol dehydrogenase family)